MECFTQVRDILHVGFVDTHRTTWVLEISAEPSHGHILLRRKYERRARNSVALFGALSRRRAVSVELDPGDRIIRLRLDDGSSLAMELFGSVNVFLINPHGFIEESFKDPKQWSGRAYLEARGAPRPVPAIDASSLKSVTEITEKLASGAAHFNKPLTLEFLHALGPETDVHSALAVLDRMLGNLRSGRPRIYHVDGRPTMFSVIDLPKWQEKEESRGRIVSHILFDSVNEGIQAYVSERAKAARLDGLRSEIARACRGRLKKLDTLRLALQTDQQNARRHEVCERQAHLLAAHAGEIRRGMACITVKDEFEEDHRDVVIELAADLSPQENIARYYAKAKKLKASVRKIDERLQTIEQESKRLAADLAAVESSDVSWRLVQELHRRFVREGWIQTKKPERVRARSDDEETMSFREYRVHGGWTVYVGQNDRKNDLLTFRFSKKNDLWFHARGVPGSHVVLRRTGRTDNPDKLALEQTASLAAFFSKAKTSSLVPVSFTERKYVRRPKGAPPGKVVLEREEVLIVPPGEPPGGQLRIENQNDIG